MSEVCPVVSWSPGRILAVSVAWDGQARLLLRDQTGGRTGAHTILLGASSVWPGPEGACQEDGQGCSEIQPMAGVWHCVDGIIIGPIWAASARSALDTRILSRIQTRISGHGA